MIVNHTVAGPLDEPECPSAVALAEYVDGTLSADDTKTVEGHLVQCADCRQVVAEAALFAAEHALAVVTSAREERPAHVAQPRRRSWRAVAYAGLSAAAALIIAFHALNPAPGGTPPDLSALIAASTAQPTRLVDARLAGFPYAPAPIRTRDVSRPAIPPTVHDAAVSVERAAAGQEAADHVAGIASLALGDLDASVRSLRRAAERAPGDARVWSDLSAALVTRAESQGDPEDANAARSAAERALAISADLPEALFNRALALEILGPPDAAARAWESYVRVDPASRWADEARARADVPR